MSRRLAGLLLGLVLLSGAAPARPAGAPATADQGERRLEAVRIDASNAEGLLIGGPDAIGGIGDWYLGNDRVEVIIDDPSRRHGRLNHGGTIVDAGVHGRRGEDQLGQLFPIVNLDQRVQLGFDTARAEVDPGGAWARIVVEGRGGMSTIPRDGSWLETLSPLVPDSVEVAQVHPVTVYEVRPGESFVRITSTLRNGGDEDAPIFSYADAWMRGGRSMRAFVGYPEAPERSSGFHHAGFDRRSILATGGLMAPSAFVAMAGLHSFAPVAYALASPERAATGRTQFGVTGKHVTLFNAFVEDDGWKELGALGMAGAVLGEIPAGQSFVFERRLYVSGRGDVASLTDLILHDLGAARGDGGVAGRVEPPGIRASVVIATDGGAPVTQAGVATRGPEAGRFRAVLPPGRYNLLFRAEQRAARRVTVDVPESGFVEVPTQRFEEPAWLEIPRAFSDGGPGRLVVVGIDGTPDPVFEPELVDFRVAGSSASSGSETREIVFVGRPLDPKRVALRPGRYRIVATRGPEYDVAEVSVELSGPGATSTLAPFQLDRIVTLPDLVSADFHVHAEASDDSGMNNRARLAGYVAEHVDVMVTTDHDHLGGFEPALDALDVRDRIRVVQGVEVTSSVPSSAVPWTLGHHNAWPLVYRPHAHRKGAPSSQNRDVAGLYASLRRDHGARVIQLNHALKAEDGVREGSYLTHLGTVGRSYDPTAPLDAWPNRVLLDTVAEDGTRAIDFDAIEVMNGNDFAQYRRLREAWHWLLLQGVKRTATGNSDSHGPGQVAAYPRNYVAFAGGGDAARADPAAFDAAVRDGRLFATTGPLITRFRVGGGGMGDLVAARDGTVGLRVAVAAAPWVPVDEVRILIDGEVARTFRGLPASGEVLRLDERLELTVRRDAFVTVEAGVPLRTDPARWSAGHRGRYADVAPGFVPQAVSNPIWLDADGDGRFTPPGLGSRVRDWRDDDSLLLVGSTVAILAMVWFWLRRRTGLAPRR